MTTVEKKAPTLTGSQDLLAYFKLIPIYKEKVAPYPLPDRTKDLDPSISVHISGLPGNLDMEPDSYLMNLLRDPQAVETGPEIRPLDAETLKDAFSLKEGPVPGFDASFLGTDEAGNGNGSSNSNQYLAESKHYNTSPVDGDHNGERKHKKKKKKRKHGHEHDEEGHHGDHKKKKKKKKDRERRDEYNNSESLIVD